MSVLGENILEGLEDALHYAKGNTEGQRSHNVSVPQNINVKAIRRKLQMSQQEFSDSFGFSIHSIRNWEQGKRHPRGTARVLLTVIERNPQAVQHALADTASMS